MYSLESCSFRSNASSSSSSCTAADHCLPFPPPSRRVFAQSSRSTSGAVHVVYLYGIMKFCPHATRPRDDESGKEKTKRVGGIYHIVSTRLLYEGIRAGTYNKYHVWGASRDIVQIFALGPKKTYSSSFGLIAIIMHYIIIVPVVRRVTTNRARIVVGTRDHG